MDQPTPPQATPTKRRQFFAIGMRTVIIGGIGSYALSQEAKRRRLANDPNCIRLDTCQDCVELPAGCSKDKAENFRAQNS
jgi:hypothetical protein